MAGSWLTLRQRSLSGDSRWLNQRLASERDSEGRHGSRRPHGNTTADGISAVDLGVGADVNKQSRLGCLDIHHTDICRNGEGSPSPARRSQRKRPGSSLMHGCAGGKQRLRNGQNGQQRGCAELTRTGCSQHSKPRAWRRITRHLQAVGASRTETRTLAPCACRYSGTASSESNSSTEPDTRRHGDLTSSEA